MATTLADYDLNTGLGLTDTTIQQISEVTPDAWAKARRTNVHANATKQLAA